MKYPPAEFVVSVGSSTGGPSALRSLVSQIGPNFKGALVVIQHLRGEFSATLVDWLQQHTSLRCCMAKDNDTLAAGHLYLAPGGSHLVLDENERLRFQQADPKDIHAPLIDRFFESAAQNSRREVVGVLLSGMGSDGALGLASLKRKGFPTVTQNEETCVVYGMPRAAVQLKASDIAMEPSDIGRFVDRYELRNKEKKNSKKVYNRELLKNLAKHRRKS